MFLKIEISLSDVIGKSEFYMILSFLIAHIVLVGT